MQISQEMVAHVSKSEQPWLQKKRADAWAIASTSPHLPFYKYGLDIYTPLTGMNPQTVGNGTVTDNLAQHPSVQKDLHAPEGIFDFPLDRFSALHVACAPVLYLRIPDNQNSEQPIIIQKSHQTDSFFHHLVVDVGNHSKAVILDSSSGEGAYHSSGTELRLGEGSSLLYASIQSLGSKTHHFSMKKTVLERDATLEWLTVDMGSALILSRLHATLAGSGSSIKNKLLAFGSENQHFDFSATSVHAAPDTHSNIIQRAVLDDAAKMVFNGMVKIQSNAPRSNGFQKEDTLLLSDQCQASPIPALEIDNNDVRCSHATTVGQVDREQIFYLQSRGLSESEATRLVVRGFFEPFIASIPHSPLQEELRSIVQKKLKEGA